MNGNEIEINNGKNTRNHAAGEPIFVIGVESACKAAITARGFSLGGLRKKVYDEFNPAWIQLPLKNLFEAVSQRSYRFQNLSYRHSSIIVELALRRNRIG